MILILSHPQDVHVQAVVRHLDRFQAQLRILDLSQFPQNARLTMFYGPGSNRASLTGLAEGLLDFSQVRAAWWRRPQPFGFEADLKSVDFAQSECEEAVAGLWQSLDARWMNPPVLDSAASRKSWQLKLAEEVGLKPPETLITNCPEAADAFIERLGGVICKPLATSLRYWRETRQIGPEERMQLRQLRHAPAILQELIPGADIRVTVVGDQIFAAEIDSSSGNYALDFRMNHQLKINETQLPPQIVSGIVSLMDRLGLIYGALDFRRDDRNGQLRFLEINPAGQWLFVEQQTGQPIARAVAGQLAKMAA